MGKKFKVLLVFSYSDNFNSQVTHKLIFEEDLILKPEDLASCKAWATYIFKKGLYNCLSWFFSVVVLTFIEALKGFEIYQQNCWDCQTTSLLLLNLIKSQEEKWELSQTFTDGAGSELEDTVLFTSALLQHFVNASLILFKLIKY